MVKGPMKSQKHSNTVADPSAIFLQGFMENVTQTPLLDWY